MEKADGSELSDSDLVNLDCCVKCVGYLVKCLWATQVYVNDENWFLQIIKTYFVNINITFVSMSNILYV